MPSKGIFIGATGQNVGKTTLCLGLIALLQKKFSKIGFIKPVGQRHVLVESGESVDKDVVLFKKHFNLPQSYKLMSPVLFPKGFTRDYLDGHCSQKEMEKQIVTSFETIASQNDYTIVEGTGHIGVGSITDLNNAKVAKLLDLDVILISSGGIGKAFDELALNRCLLKEYGVKVKGVILNRVLTDKKPMVEEYIQKALKRWNIPLIGCVPFSDFLNSPCMHDFEMLFKTPLLQGHQYRYKHFQKTHLVSTSVKNFEEYLLSDQLIITSSSREDVIKVLIDRAKKCRSKNEPFHTGLILTGKSLPTASILKKIKQTEIPFLYTQRANYEVMQMINSYTSKILNEDQDKVEMAISLIEHHINLDLLCK